MITGLGQRVWFCVLLLGALAGARAELTLTNFDGARPIKIMPIGDSITDDCSMNGAWRLYLQPLLEANGYPFIFTGRQASSPQLPSFTKVNHEGYCGTVIAPPGVFAVHGYSTTNAYLLNIAADALGVTNNRPDLVLLLIGANDIGRGRNPWQVATNDMPRLLDLMLSNVPSANILLAKATSLQSANIPGLSYGAYATNVPIYNAALQLMVNERRALGQNVFLADMYSAVDYNTMFLADHVHPNGLGLAAIANEWLARLQAITLRTNEVTLTLVHGGDWWKYCDTGRDLGTSWARTDYDDSGWSNGIARLGYGDPATATTVSFGPDPTNKYVTTYFRHLFVVPQDVVITNLDFRLARAGGAAVWVNGLETFRTNLPSGPITYTNLALSSMNRFMAHVFYPTNLAALLPAGTNLIAVELHLSSANSPSLGFDLELIGTGYPVVPPSLSITQTGGDIVLSWPAANAGGFTLYSTTNPAVTESWTRTPAVTQTNGGQITATLSPEANAQFYRLQRP